VDLLATFAALTRQTLPPGAAPDSFNVLPALLGESHEGRRQLVQHAGALALRQGSWKLIAPSRGAKFNRYTNTELGNDPNAQLYEVTKDPGETRNLATQETERTQTMIKSLEDLRAHPASREAPH